MKSADEEANLKLVIFPLTIARSCKLKFIKIECRKKLKGKSRYILNKNVYDRFYFQRKEEGTLDESSGHLISLYLLAKNNGSNYAQSNCNPVKKRHFI